MILKNHVKTRAAENFDLLSFEYHEKGEYFLSLISESETHIYIDSFT